MERGIFPRPDFQEALAAFVLLRINATGTPEEQALYTRLAGESLPTYVILEPDGTLVASTGWSGGTSPERELLDWLLAHARR